MDYLSFIERTYGNSGSTGSPTFSLLVYAAMILAWWFLFIKADEPGWKSILPLLNIWTLFEIVYGSGWKSLLLLVPILNFVVLIAFWIRMAQAYGKGILFGIGLIFLPNIFLLILAFGNARYRGPATSSFL